MNNHCGEGLSLSIYEGENMEKLRKRLLRAAVFLGAMTFLGTGCQMKSGETQDSNAAVDIRDSLTQEEIKSGEAFFYLSEDLLVDAKITPQEKYTDGLKSYYIEVYCAAEDGRNLREFIEDPDFYKKSLGEVGELLGREIEGSFKLDTLETRISGIGINSYSMNYQTFRGEDYRFHSYWEWEEEYRDETDKLYTAFAMYITPVNDDVVGNNVWNWIQDYIPDYSQTEVSFLNKEETGNYYKEYLEELTGRTINEDYDCIPVTNELIAEVNAIVEADFGIESVREEYCVYRYYCDVDGFPYMDCYLPYYLKDGKEASFLAKITLTNGNCLSGLAQWAQEVFVTEEGLYSLWTYSSYFPGEVYQEAQEVISPDATLQKVKDYYKKQVLLEEAVVKEVKLVYAGWFGEDETGIIQPILQPFWRVKVYQKENNSILYFYYDAFTGDIIQEAGQE